jgi:hypothetical protein
LQHFVTSKLFKAIFIDIFAKNIKIEKFNF